MSEWQTIDTAPKDGRCVEIKTATGEWGMAMYLNFTPMFGRWIWIKPNGAPNGKAYGVVNWRFPPSDHHDAQGGGMK